MAYISIRVPADFKPKIEPTLYPLNDIDGKPHPLTHHPCAACGELTDVGPVVLVPVGVSPENRTNARRTNAACVVVHLKCSGYTEDEVRQLQYDCRT